MSETGWDEMQHIEIEVRRRKSWRCLNLCPTYFLGHGGLDLEFPGGSSKMAR